MTTVVVLGMHHAGTSLVASMLDALGVHMGKSLLGPNDHNPWGHYEDTHFLRMNKTILHLAGGEWNRPPGPRAIVALANRTGPHIKALIEKRAGRDLWGWKDPRTCLTIGLYHPHLKDPRYVYARRHPVSIAGSLRRRYGNDVRWGNLIKAYRRGVDQFVKDNWPLALFEIHYEHLMDRETSRAVATTLALFVGAPLERVDDALERIKYEH